MHQRTIRRSAALAAAGVLAFAGVAAADSVRADGDLVTPDVQNVVYLGQVAPSAEVVAHVGFVLTCSRLSHVDPGQSITLSLESSLPLRRRRRPVGVGCNDRPGARRLDR